MSTIKAIRGRLGVSQAELASGIGCSQSNVSFYEKGQVVTPDAARKLIAFAAERGLSLTFDHIYANAPLPPEQPQASAVEQSQGSTQSTTG